MSKLRLRKDELLYRNLETGVSVFSAWLLPANTPVVIKETAFLSVPEANTALREACSMLALQHPHILRVLDCYFDLVAEGQSTINIVSERMESDLGTETRRRAEQAEYWREEELMSVFKALVSALSYAEEHGVTHRDIKPENIFLSAQSIKLGDFGSSTQLLTHGFMSRSIVGTPIYLSPELKQALMLQLNAGFVDLEYDSVKSDAYSLGVTMAHLCLLRAPSELGDLSNLAAGLQALDHALQRYPVLRPLIIKLLAEKPEDRPTFIDLRNSPPFADRADLTCAISHCLNCGSNITNRDWQRKVEGNLLQFRGFFDVCCSHRCAEARAFSDRPSQAPAGPKPIRFLYKPYIQLLKDER